MNYQRVKRKPLILIAIITVLAGVFFYIFGPYGVVGAGVLGICAVFGIAGDDTDTLGDMYHAPEAEDPTRSWIPKALEIGYSLALIGLGIILANALHVPS